MKHKEDFEVSITKQPTDDASWVILIRIPNNVFCIDIKEDKIYYNGNRILTTKPIRKYLTDSKKEANVGRKHRRIYEYKDPKGKFVFVINVGYDGRLFFLLFDENYGKFRARPIWQGSYWHCRSEKAKYWYEQDLINPKMKW